MIERTSKETLLRLASQFPVVGITGPRQSGKTTLAKEVFSHKKFVSFDDTEMRNLARSNPYAFVKAFPDGLIIDEAQKVPEIFDAVKLNVDSTAYCPGKFILTGSSQFKLRENMSDSLAGRAAYLKLLPFSASELKGAGKLSEDVYDVIFKGQYPPLYDENKNCNAEDWFDNYIDTYLDLDIRNQINQKNISTFKTFIQICAVRSGNIISMDTISRETGISAPTVRSWLSILESSYIIHFLEPDINNLGKKLIKSPKLYFTDTGLLCHLLRLKSKEDLLLSKHRGAVVETFAVSELLKNRLYKGKNPYLSYYRDLKGFEVDVIASWDKTFAIEIKSSHSPESKLSENTRKYLARREEPDTRGAVFYLGNHSMRINGTDYVSWKDWNEYCNLGSSFFSD